MNAWQMIYDCLLNQQGPEPNLSNEEKFGKSVPDPIQYTPELPRSQADLPPIGYARTFEMQADENNALPTPVVEQEQVYWE